jgi:hypothetical protein
MDAIGTKIQNLPKSHQAKSQMAILIMEIQILQFGSTPS